MIRFRSALPVLSISVLLVSCAEQEPATSTAPPAVAGVEVYAGDLGWHGIHLEMSAAEVRSAASESFSIDEPQEGGCEGVAARFRHHEREILVTFSGDGAEDEVLSIFVPITSPHGASELAAALKSRIENVRYQPSRHEPSVTEAEDTKPHYVLTSNPDQGVILGPGEGVWISLVDCVD